MTTQPSDPTTDATPLWHRLPGEGSRAYAAFQIYCRLGPNRSLEEVGRRHYSGPGVAPERPRKTSAPGGVKKWCRQFDWVERAAAWDLHQAAIHQAAAEEQERRKARQWVDRRAEQFDRQHRLGVALQDQAETLLAFPPAAQTIVEEGGKRIIHVQPVEVLDRYRAGRMAAVGAELAERAIDRAIEVSTPSARPAAESAAPHHYAAAEARLSAFRQRMQLTMTVPAEPPDDDHQSGVFHETSAAR